MEVAKQVENQQDQENGAKPESRAAPAWVSGLSPIPAAEPKHQNQNDNQEQHHVTFLSRPSSRAHGQSPVRRTKIAPKYP